MKKSNIIIKSKNVSLSLLMFALLHLLLLSFEISGVRVSPLSLSSFVNQLSSFFAGGRFGNLDDVVYKEADANDGQEEREAGDEHEELIEYVHALAIVISHILGLFVPLFSLHSNLSLGICFFFRWLVLWSQRVS